MYFFFHFYHILIEIPVSKQCRPDQTPRSAASDFGLHCLPMSQKWDARLIWVNICLILTVVDVKSGTAVSSRRFGRINTTSTDSVRSVWAAQM